MTISRGVFQTLRHNRSAQLLPAHHEPQPFAPAVLEVIRRLQQQYRSQKIESRVAQICSREVRLRARSSVRRMYRRSRSEIVEVMRISAVDRQAGRHLHQRLAQLRIRMSRANRCSAASALQMMHQVTPYRHGTSY